MFFFVLFLIVSLILWNAYIFFQKIKREERAKMEIYTLALKELAVNEDFNANVSLHVKVIESTANIPRILVGENEDIISWEGLDSIKAKKEDYLRMQLEKMKSENEPIKLDHFEMKQFVYYRNSTLLNKLSYYPLALILIILLFLVITYMLFVSSKIADQNKLWVGMAKETAHQIGTPLSSLLGWMEILKTENIATDYIPEIKEDIDRLNTIANRFSKIGSVPVLKKENIVSFAKSTVLYLQSRSSKRVFFHFKTNNDVVFSNINKELFGWVLENLIKNAVDAMQGKGNLGVAIKATDKKIMITVSDTGKGITRSRFKEIFKPGVTTKKRGWGLGLSLSKRIVEKYHNGKIFVQKSQINKGTSIQIQLHRVL